MTCTSTLTTLILNSIATSSTTRLRHVPTRNPLSPHFSHFLPFHSSSARATTIFQNSGLPLIKRRLLLPIASSLQLPLLPFNINEVLVPTERKTLHLYEARYLSLLDESLLRKKKLFVHFVLDPISISDSTGEASFAAKFGCLILIENVERLDVGALVTIRGIGRTKILNFVKDEIPESSSKVSSKVVEVREAIYNLNSLEIKLKTPNEASLQTHITNSLLWAEKEPSFECDEDFIPSLAERVSFAALQPITGSTEAELLKLQRLKLEAMDLKDTYQRLEDSLEIVKENISMVAAKLAIQSLEIQ
ncbi:uncharacterized protein LOC122316596 isoform X4 [Carya illinoinensis]|uniref:Lon N-terminal domain-containing protein n=1 Tax=Carya illinoinensis TaxID=32201 RepID=A0A8T1Q5M5_CARIL|nr:uncharacterized protein LOC122316596 isoform X4 [Carya illinoinensis]KAG6649801.1 hypothetical protein CIPAW_07G235600 [Carya illinoinensis]